MRNVWYKYKRIKMTLSKYSGLLISLPDSFFSLNQLIYLDEKVN
jgi:hypothetical protein